MKTFIYTIKDTWHKGRGYSTKQVTIFRLKKGSLHHVATSVDTHCDDFQLVLQTMERTKELPKRAYERNQFGGHKFCYPHMMKDAGIANFLRV